MGINNYAQIQSTLYPVSSATPQALLRNASGIVDAYGTVVPVDGTAGFITGATFKKTDGAANTSLYVNEGSVTSSDFNAAIADVPAEYGANSSVGPSSSLWVDCPWAEILLNPTYGISYFNDYVARLGGGQQNLTGTSTTEIADWIQTEVTSGLTARSEVSGGVLRVSSEASAAANDGLTVMYRATPFIPAADKTIWFEARIAMTNIDAGAGAEDQFFVGLTNTITSALPSGVVDDTVDKIGFFHHDGSTVATLSFITAKTTVEETTASAATGLVTGTFVKVGFKCEWVGSIQTITPYVNGVAGTAHNTVTSVPTPATGLGICLAAVSEGTTTALLDVDWVRVAQLK